MMPLGDLIPRGPTAPTTWPEDDESIPPEERERYRRAREERERQYAASGGDAAESRRQYASSAQNDYLARLRGEENPNPNALLRRWLTESAPTAQDLTASYQDEQALPGIETDPEGLAAQRQALAALQDVYQSKGMTAADRAMFNQRQAGVAQAARSQREALNRMMAARGMLGSGLEYAGAQMASQGASNALSGMEAEAQAEAQRRALSAMQAAGGLGTQMRGQGDDLARFNASYMRDVNTRNAATRNRQEDTRIAGTQQAWENTADLLNERRGAPARHTGSKAEGALGGAASGAATGAAGGPWTALLGGALGLGAGYAGSEDDEE